MNSIIKNQKITRRPKTLSLHLPKKKANIEEKKRQLRNQAVLSPKIDFMKIWKKLIRSYKKYSVYIVTGAFITCIITFLSLSAPISGMTHKQENLDFPDDDYIEEYLFSFLGPDEDYPEDIKLPDTAILDSLTTTSYTVAGGDTVSEIALQYKVRLDTILSFNNIKDVRKLRVGMQLEIPQLDGVLYKVRKGDSLSKIADQNGVSLNRLLDVNNLTSEVITAGQELFLPGASMSEFDLKKAIGELFIYPCKGRLTSGFGMRNDPFTGIRRMHYGIDLANSEGTYVKAAMAGTVAAIGSNPKGYGNYLILKHQGGFQTLYAHLLYVNVKKGQYVEQGERIGKLGNTGRSTGPHLHFSIYQYQKPINPLKYLF